MAPSCCQTCTLKLIMLCDHRHPQQFCSVARDPEQAGADRRRYHEGIYQEERLTKTCHLVDRAPRCPRCRLGTSHQAAGCSARPAGCGRRVRPDHPRRRLLDRFRAVSAPERARCGSPRRRIGPTGRGGDDLSRRFGARGRGAHGLCPPLRTPLLPGLGEPRPRRTRPADDPDRQLHQRLYLARPHQLLRSRPHRRAGEGALGRGGQAGLLHQHRDRIGGGQGEAGCQERETPGRGQPAVRAHELRGRQGAVPGGAPLPLAGHRLPAGPRRGDPRRH